MLFFYLRDCGNVFKHVCAALLLSFVSAVFQSTSSVHCIYIHSLSESIDCLITIFSPQRNLQVSVIAPRNLLHFKKIFERVRVMSLTLSLSSNIYQVEVHCSFIL